MSYIEGQGSELQIRQPLVVDLEKEAEIAAKIERTTLPIGKMTDLLIRMDGHWCLPKGNKRKKDDVDVVQKWIRLCQGYLNSGNSLNEFRKKGAVCSTDLEPMLCRYYLERVYEEHNGRNNNSAVLNRDAVQAANRAFEALVGDGKNKLFFGDPGLAKDLWHKCLMHHIYHTLHNTVALYTQIFPDRS